MARIRYARTRPDARTPASDKPVASAICLSEKPSSFSVISLCGCGAVGWALAGKVPPIGASPRTPYRCAARTAI
jgi:hypothetical protein